MLFRHRFFHRLFASIFAPKIHSKAPQKHSIFGSKQIGKSTEAHHGPQRVAQVAPRLIFARIWDPCCPPLAPFWCPFGSRWRILVPFWAPLAPFCFPFAPFWSLFGSRWLPDANHVVKSPSHLAKKPPSQPSHQTTKAPSHLAHNVPSKLDSTKSPNHQKEPKRTFLVHLATFAKGRQKDVKRT